MYKAESEEIWKRFENIIYNNSKDYLSLNFNDKGGKTSYYLGDIST